MRFLAILAVSLCLAIPSARASEPGAPAGGSPQRSLPPVHDSQLNVGNRLIYLDDFCDPYTLGLNSPKLTTPQWVGEPGVEAVVTLGIDDMRVATKDQLAKIAAGKLAKTEVGDSAKYESFLRPVLNRLKKIDGRAPVSIMCNAVDLDDPQLQAWLKEGLSLETHTADHPCPCLQQAGFERAKDTYNRCVDQLSQVPGSKPVAFRFPCCDSRNTPSPRAFAELLAGVTPAGNFLQLDTSVAVILNADDPALPQSIVRDAQNRPRFSKYVPFPNFVNRVFNYPYPFVVAGRIWEFPIATPDDWQGFNLQQAGNPQTLEDMQKYLDAVVQKRGVDNVVFHPYGWIRSEQMTALVDYADRTYGKRVKFLTFRECMNRLNEHLLAGQPVRAADGSDNGVRLLDLNNDGAMDVLLGNDAMQRTRIWDPQNARWIEGELPAKLVSGSGKARITNQVRFGVLDASGLPVMIVRDGQTTGAWRFDGAKWIADETLLKGLDLNGTPISTGAAGKDLGVRMRDLDDDGVCELIVANPSSTACFRWNAEQHTWQRLPFALPDGVLIVGANGRDGGTRFADLDGDGLTDVINSCERGTSVFLMDSMNTGWTRTVLAAASGDPNALPMFANAGVNGGGWIADRKIWFQNEATAKLPDGILQRSFNELLGETAPRPLSPKQALKSMHVTPGFRVELVASEPLVMDPVGFDWGPDGKFWVVEMADYPTGLDGKGKPCGRVRFLEDSDGDGKYDKSTLFADGLSFPNGVMAWRDGVLISAAPQVIFARDKDGDGKCDEQTVLFDGFGEGNQQHRANGFKWSMDGSVHMANGDSGGNIRSVKTGQVLNLGGRDLRIWPDDGRMETVTGVTQFGRNRDDWGHWFGTNNSNPLFQFMLEDRYLRRNPHVAPPGSIVMVADPLITLNPLSRTLARFNEPHTANHFTSACGGMIYRDHALGGDVEGNLFACEPVHNLVHREQVRPNGLTFKGVRTPDEQTSHFLRSTDNWFRPVALRTGPDGAVWIADMYRLVMEHPEWIPDDQEARMDLRAGHDKGRIYRVVSVRHPERKIGRLDKLATSELVAALDSPNGAERDRVQMLLDWRDDKSAIEPLRKLAVSASLPIVRAQALWTLSLLDGLEDQQLLAALADKDPPVQTQAIRMAEPRLNQRPELGSALVKLLDGDDLDLQLQLAYTLGEWNDPRAGEALGTLLVRHTGDKFLAAAALSSVNRQNLSAVMAKALAAEQPAGAILGRLFAIAAAEGDDHVLRGAVQQVVRSADGNYSESQLRAVAAVLGELQRRKKPLADALGSETMASLNPAFAAARRYVADPEQRESLRVCAIQLLAFLADPSDVALMAERFSPQETSAIQRSAIAAFLRIASAKDSEPLFAAWDTFSPAVRGFALDELLGRGEWTAALLDRLESGAIAPNQISAVYRQRLADSKSAPVRDRAAKLFAANLGSRADVVARYQTVCALHGDRQRGREVFLKRCSVCHVLEGKGHAVGADLTTLVNKAPDYLLIAILDPNRAVEDKFVNYIVALDDGRQLSGVLASESGESLTLRAQEGKDQVILRKEVDALKNTGKSYMPEGLEVDMTEQDLADVIAYLGGFGPPPKQFAGNDPRTIKADAKGNFELSATAARIYGRTAAFEPTHQNIGYWGSADDSASWTVDVPAEGKFKVLLDYACANGAAGNTFAIDIAGKTLTGKISGTGTWDNYSEVELATVSLPAGERTINFRSIDLPAGKSLLDLRTIRLKPVN